MSNNLRYRLGHKRCTFCGIFLNVPESRCPCCKTMLRTRSRSKNKKIEVYEQKVSSIPQLCGNKMNDVMKI